MKYVVESQKKWSERGLSLAIWSTVASVLLALADGVLKGPMSLRYGAGIGTNMSLQAMGYLSMISTWCYDLRPVAEQGMFVGIVLFFGAKFFEGRTIFTVGFETLDNAKHSVTATAFSR